MTGITKRMDTPEEEQTLADLKGVEAGGNNGPNLPPLPAKAPFRRRHLRRRTANPRAAIFMRMMASSTIP
jgi:hypothetical protein